MRGLVDERISQAMSLKKLDELEPLAIINNINLESSCLKLSSGQLKQINDCFIKFEGNPNIVGMLDDGRLEVKK